MPAPVARRLGYALKRAQHALRTSIDQVLRPVGITMPQYALLCALEAEPGLSNARLARAAFVTPQTMQGILANLERAHIVSREPHATNARILCATLTSKGRAVLKRAHRAVADVEKRMVASFDADKTEDLWKALSQCTENLTGDIDGLVKDGRAMHDR